VHNKVYAGPLLLFYAPSGVGKSSLLLARVVPQLREDGAHVLYFDRWAETDPLARLKKELVESAREACTPLREELPAHPLAQVVGEVGEATEKPIVLVLDQFEQFLLLPGSRLEPVRSELAALVRANLDAHVVISLREEFLGELESFRSQILNLFRITFRLEHLSEKGAKEAIVEPVKFFKKSYDPGLVEKLLRDMRQDKKVMNLRRQ
jgi:hypothetical protein